MKKLLLSLLILLSSQLFAQTFELCYPFHEWELLFHMQVFLVKMN